MGMAMQEKDKPHFMETLIALADYYGKELSEMTLRIYWSGLQKYDLDAVKRAFFNHTKTPIEGKFMPRVDSVVMMLEGTAMDSAYLAWTKVEQAVKSQGIYADVIFDDWIIHRVISDMGGWIVLCGKQNKDWPFVGKEFEVRYRGFSIKRVVEQYPAMLSGMAGAENRKNGFKTEPPMLIGDAAKALAVQAGGVENLKIGMTRAENLISEVSQNLITT
jgi:hypothetical protein